MGSRGRSGGVSAKRTTEFTGKDSDYSAILSAITGSGYSVFGLRTEEKDIAIGRYTHLSADLNEYSDNYGGKLNGTSAIELPDIDKFSDVSDLKEAIPKALNKVGSYHMSHIYLVGGRDSDYGDDPSEIVINTTEFGRNRRGARILYKFK